MISSSRNDSTVVVVACEVLRWSFGKGSSVSSLRRFATRGERMVCSSSSGVGGSMGRVVVVVVARFLWNSSGYADGHWSVPTSTVVKKWWRYDELEIKNTAEDSQLVEGGGEKITSKEFSEKNAGP